MYYTVDIDNNIESLAYCLNHVYKWIEDVWEWTIKINSEYIDYGIYFNCDLERKELEISNAPRAEFDDSLDLDEIIKEINGESEEDEDEE